MAELASALGRLAEAVATLEAALRAERAAAAAALDAAEQRAAVAEAEIATLRLARQDDEKLRAEAAEALDAAIGELRLMSRTPAHG